MKFLLIFLAVFAIASGQNDSLTTEVSQDGNVTSLIPLNVSVESTTTAVDNLFLGNETDLTNNDTTPAVPTTTPPTTTTQAPSSLSAYHYSFNDTLDKSCIQLSSAMQFSIFYQSQSKKTVHVVFNAENGTVDRTLSHCGNGTTTPAVLAIQYENYSVEYTFAQNADASKYTLGVLQLNYVSEDVTENLNLFAVLNKTLEVSKGKSYRCDADKTYTFEESNSTVTITEECGDDFTTSDIVPIAVGCALAALVVIVLIAYLIGRRRSRQKGYQSV